MEALLAKRIDQMKDGGTDDAPTDQYRAFFYIVEQLEHGNRPLRLMIQASAGAPFYCSLSLPVALARLGFVRLALVVSGRAGQPS